jgi:hypothetical protein
VLAAPLALILGAIPEVWAETEGPMGSEAGACSAEALATALHAQRPLLAVHAFHPEIDPERPPAGAIRVRLTDRGGSAVLEILAPGSSIVRSLSAAGDCERNVAMAALIIDGALDELRVSEGTPKVDSLAPPIPFGKQLHLSTYVGAGAQQGVFGFVPAFAVVAAGRFRFLEVTLDVDLGLPSTTAFSLTPPEAGKGTLSATTLTVDLGAGVAPRLGPGRLTCDAVFGVGLAFAQVNSGSVFQQQTETSTKPLVGLRLGYVVDLPRGVFLMARGEEHVSPATGFQVVGSSFPLTGNSTVMTPVWTFQALGFVGYHFL